MPDFANPFSGNMPRPMTPEELIRAIRLTLAAEEEAVHMYTALAEAAPDELAKKVLLDIANEERQHAGEFLHLLRLLAPDEEGFLAEGKKEVEEMARQVRRTAG